MKSQEKRNKLIYILIFIFLVSLSVLFYVNTKGPIFTQVYYSSFEVSNSVGFDLNSTALKFGRVIPQSESSKELNIENKYDFPIEVRVYSSGGLKDIVYIKERIIIEPNETKSFLVYLSVPQNQDYGNYSGEITLALFKK